MSNLDNVKNELKELMDYVVENDSYLKSKLKDKSVGMDDEYNEIVESLDKNKDNKLVYGILKNAIMEMEKNRGEELLKRYGKLILKDRIYNKLMGKKK